jgi:hypothetical protein
MTHKEFFTWLEGYLEGNRDDKFVDPRPIAKKMEKVNDIDPFFPNPKPMTPIQIPRPENPFKDDGYDDLGAPPKIIM